LYIGSTKSIGIAQNKLHIEDLKQQFQSKSTFSIADLLEFYRTFEPDVKKATVNWRIHTLVHEGVIMRVGRGTYKLGKGDTYIPEVSKKLASVYKKLAANFPYLSACLWNTSVLNEFMLHQPAKFYHLIEVDKDAVESVFYYLKDKNYSVFMEPSEQMIHRYMIDEKEPWVVKSLVTESPIQFIDGIPTVTIEKLLVDVFCDSVIFNAQQGSEMIRIFNEAFETYTISESKLLRYASRRRKKMDLVEYLNNKTKDRQQR
jgi:hypothetical protein